jgi:histidyl-tRNA synthetase
MLQRPRGTRDFLPDEMEARRGVEGRMRSAAMRYGYREVCTPEFEELELFTIRSGEGIINEMYAFQDKGERWLALRPEITAAVLRLYVNEARVWPKPIRWFYFGDCFRYERPQKGRYRQFWQFGAELIGADTALADAEVIIMANDLLDTAGISFELQIGHLALMRHILGSLPEPSRRQVRALLDKKQMDELSGFLESEGAGSLCQTLLDLASARTIDEICAITGDLPETTRLKEVCSLLEAAGIGYTLNPAISRGLDYYTGIVFEAFAEGLGAENQIMGGGAYRLAHLFGGDDVPSCGFAIGFDRVMVARGEIQPDSLLKVFVAHTLEGRSFATEVAQRLRNAGITVETDVAGRGLAAQLAHAGKTASYAVIIGGKEAASREVTIKDLARGTQETVRLDDASQVILGGTR